jgi:hypothetical protein
MMTPFEYFARNIKERIEDEQSDIKAAGGIFSIAKRQADPFVKSMDEAMEFTQMNNKRLAELAAVLPGNTQQYIEVSKRISDSVSRVVVNNKTAAIEFANELRSQRGAEALTGGGRKETQGAITELLGEMTKKTVLAGLGTGGGGAGGIAGAYGLPGLTERMLTQDEVSMGQFQRYAAIFKDPLIMDALSRFIPKINATTAGTLDRFKILNKLFDEVLPPEMIRKFERSTAGILEAFNTSIFGPETGLFGLGRKMSGLGKRMDDFGNYIKVLDDGTLVAVKSLEEASDIDLSLFDMLRDIFANLSITLYPIISNLPLIFDPLKKIGNLLVDARHLTGRFLFSFEAYKKGLQDMVKGMSEAEQTEFNKISIDLRASLAAVNNLFRKFGVIDIAEFQANAKKIMSTQFDAGAMIKEFFNTFLDSKVAKDLGRTVGLVIGTVLSEVAGVMKQFMGLTKASGLVEGLKEGFNQAGGVKAIKDIISMVFQGLFNLLLTVIKTAPFESAMVAGLFVLPSIIAGTISSAVTAVFSGGLPKLKAAFQNMIANLMRVKPAIVKDLGSPTPITDPSRLLSAAQEKGGLVAKTTSSLATFNKTLQSLGNYIKGIGPRFAGFFKGFLGKLSIFGAVLTSVISLFQGKDLATSLAKGAGPLLGAALGSALIPFLGPIGPMIGAAIGGWIGSLDAVTVPLTEIFRSIGGALQGFGDSLGIIVTLTGDLFGEIGQLIGSVFGVKGEFDGFKIALAPITLALQALEVGLKGFALLLAEVRVFFKRYFGTPKEYQDAIIERDRLNASMKESQGRINAYNASMLGTVHLQKQVNDAQYELVNGGKKLTEARKKELVAFIESAKRLDKEIQIKKEITVKKTVQEEKGKVEEKPKQAKAPGFDIGKMWNDYGSEWATNAKKFLDGMRNLPENLAWLAGYSWEKSNQAWQKIQEAHTSFENKVSQSWSKFVAWWGSLPAKLQTAINQTISALQSAWNRFTSWFSGLGPRFSSQVGSVVTALGNGTQQIVNAIINWAKSLPARIVAGFTAGQQAAKTPVGSRWDPAAKKTVIVYNDGSTSAAAEAFGSGNSFTGPLSKAISFEQKNKPPGSDLVIANSSETVIPAAGGLGMGSLLDTFRSGFNSVVTTLTQVSQQSDTKMWSGFNTLTIAYRQGQERQTSALNRITSTLMSNQVQTNARLQKLETKFSAPSMPGGLGGGAAGGVDAFTPIAQRMGLTMTSGYRPGDPGWHGANRARDFSNGTGPTPQMMQFAQYMASTYGSNLKELIYTPLGFSIKNGQRVAPYAQGAHYNHVHVAYALGPDQGKMFNSLSAAQSWEQSMVPGSVKVASITGNSKEGFGETHVTNNMTITQQPGEDGEALANRVATLFFDAVSNARSSSIFM